MPICRIVALESSTLLAERFIRFVGSPDISDHKCISTFGFQSSDVDNNKSASPSPRNTISKSCCLFHSFTRKYRYSPLAILAETA
jgi:hypothetical protein